MAQAQVLLGIKGEAKQQARTGGWVKGVLGKENHAREMHKIHSSHSVQGNSSVVEAVVIAIQTLIFSMFRLLEEANIYWY